MKEEEYLTLTEFAEQDRRARANEYELHAVVGRGSDGAVNGLGPGHDW